MVTKSTTSSVTSYNIKAEETYKLIFSKVKEYYAVKNTSDNNIYVSFLSSFSETDEGVYILEAKESIFIQSEGNNTLYFLTDGNESFINIVSTNISINPFRTLGKLNVTRNITGSYGGANNLYLTNEDNAIDPTFKNLFEDPLEDPLELVGVVNSSADVLLEQFLYHKPIGLTAIDAGNWSAVFNLKADKPNGNTRLKYVVFSRSQAGVITDLFTAYSCEINNTEYIRYECEHYQSNLNILETDYLGVRIYATTTHSSNVTLSLAYGDGTASYINTPLPIRHSQVRDDEPYKHMDTGQKLYFENMSRDVDENLIIENLKVEGLFRLLSPKCTDISFGLSGRSMQGAVGKPDYDPTYLGYLFPQANTNEYLVMDMDMPHDWEEGSIIYPHVHWRQKANQQAVFKMRYAWVENGSTFTDVAFTSLPVYIMGDYVYTYVNNTLMQMNVNNSVGISGVGKTISSCLKIILYRDDNTYIGDALVDIFGIHYFRDGVGSETLFSKNIIL